jgi:hypothetical protein
VAFYLKRNVLTCGRHAVLSRWRINPLFGTDAARKGQIGAECANYMPPIQDGRVR